MRLRLAILLMVWIMAPFVALAQQKGQVYNPEGYACDGRVRACTAYAFYRTFQANESLAKVAGYFNVTPASVAELSDLDPNATVRLPSGQPLYIPLDCRCRTLSTSQMQVPHTLVPGDNFFTLATTLYGRLTTSQAMMTANPTLDVAALLIGDTATVPIFCACPTAEQIANGVQFLLTYAVYAFEPLDFISTNFNVTAAEVSEANQLPVDAVPEKYTNVLVPLQSLPPLATMKFPYVMPPIATSTFSSSGSRRLMAGIIAGSTAGALAVLLAVGCLLLRRRGRFAKKDGQLKGGFSLVNPDLPLRIFTYKELRRATKSFRKSELLGSGGFGAVYKGTLPSGALVAVKRLRMESKHGKESFLAEVTSLSQIRHRNLVQLRGWCIEEANHLLVYDYMCNGSLDSWKTLSLELRHSVLRGVAAALSYLHEECAQCVLHRDIKSSNVLLDAEMNAYLGDFGLARLIDHRKMEKTTMMAGTLGYMAPEMPHTFKATKETDVYSFGVLMLEVMSGERPIDTAAIEQGNGILVERVWRAHEAENIMQVADARLLSFPLSDAKAELSDNELQEVSSMILESRDVVDEKLITNLLQLGLLCCNPNPEDRPSTRLVSQLLHDPENMEMALPALPVSKAQAWYSLPGFSQFVAARSPTDDCGGLIDRPSEPVAENGGSSFVASSALYSGR